MRRRYQFLVLVLAVFWVAATTFLVKIPASNQIAAPQKGFHAPNFTSDSGVQNQVALSDFENQVVLLNFWASWCQPCKTEMPAMERVYQSLKDDGFTILAVNVTSTDEVGSAQNLIENLGLTFPVLFDYSGSIQTTYKVLALPTSFFIDRKGVIQAVIIGGPMPESLIYSKVYELLEKSE